MLYAQSMKQLVNNNLESNTAALFKSNLMLATTRPGTGKLMDTYGGNKLTCMV